VPALTFALEVIQESGDSAQGIVRLKAATPAGDVAVTVPDPFSDGSLLASLSALGSRDEPSKAQAILTTGERLFQLATQSDPRLQSAYITCRDRAGDGPLSIVLDLERAGALASLPWEAMRDPAGDFLALSRSTPILRRASSLTSRRPQSPQPPIHILVILSSPSGVPTLDVEAEWSALQAATAPLRDAGLIIVERLQNPTLSALQSALRTRTVHILHFVGHGDFDAARGRGLLVFESEDRPGQPRIVTSEQIGREIGEEGTLQLAYINACRTAQTADAQRAQGIAADLIDRGLPAVIALQFPATDRGAMVFASELYRALADGLPIGEAASEARRATARTSNTTDWVAPVLYLRDGQTVQFPSARPRRKLPVAGLAALAGAAVALVLILLVALRPSEVAIPTPTLAPSLPAELPNLEIGTIRISPRVPRPGEIFRLSVTITNSGTADSGPFSYGWDASLVDPVILNAFSDRVENIPPGASKNISFPYSYGWWGSYNTQVVVDVDSEVRESDERDNRRPFDITLADVPFEIDFSLLPSNEIVQPPLEVTNDTFALWNFTLASAESPACPDAALELVEVNEGIGVQVNSSDDSCRNLPIAITILRRPVSGATLLVTTERAANITIAFFANADDDVPVFTTDPIAVAADEMVSIASG